MNEGSAGRFLQRNRSQTSTAENKPCRSLQHSLRSPTNGEREQMFATNSNGCAGIFEKKEKGNDNPNDNPLCEVTHIEGKEEE